MGQGFRHQSIESKLALRRPTIAQIRRWMCLSFCFLLALSWTLLIPHTLGGQSAAMAKGRSETIAKSAPRPELRGVWLTNVDSDVLFSKQALTAGLDRLSKLHVNTLYPTVWNWGYTLFPSTVAASITGHSQGLYPDLGNQGRDERQESTQGDGLRPAFGHRDLLAEVVELGHARQMAVIPWMEFGFMAPANAPWVKAHPEWLAQRQDGGTVKMEGTHPRVWLNPMHPEVQDFLLDLVAELVANYELDGIQFDDHLGLPVEYGYDPYTVGLYQRTHSGKMPPSDPKDPAWVKWRADQITDWVRRLFERIHATRNEVILSLSPNPATWAYENFLQDWVTWERRGYVEELVIQLYRDRLSRFRWELSQPEVKQAQAHIPVAIGILSGLKNRPVPVQRILDQVNITRRRGLAGVSFFFYETLWVPEKESEGERLRSLQALFPSPAPRATLTSF
jgi:uncharacterized lipoprotein YddW (UPF0748 family)